jgi:lactoylglutathione lyase
MQGDEMAEGRRSAASLTRPLRKGSRRHRSGRPSVHPAVSERTHTMASEVPTPSEGFVVTHFLVVEDQDRSRSWYVDVLGAEVVRERDPVYLRVANSWIILNEGGGPTDDKPNVTLEPPRELGRASAFLNLRVADIAEAHREWSAAGAEFLTEPVDHEREIRAYMRDADGHLIEVGQTTGR